MNLVDQGRGHGVGHHDWFDPGKKKLQVLLTLSRDTQRVLSAGHIDLRGRIRTPPSRVGAVLKQSAL